MKSFNELGGEYLHFTMYKENKDSMDAINMVARMLKLKSNSFGFAGTKDRRAATVQRISVKKKRVSDLLWLNNKLQNVRLGDFKHSKYPIELGQHGGNEFVIIMKNVEHIRGANCSVATRVKMVEEAVQTGLRYFYENGFLNYFGLQRFGTHEVGTHELGMKIMREDYQGVVDAICQVPAELAKALASSDSDATTGYQQDDINRARALDLWFTTRDAKAALQIMPRRFHGESRIIEHLSKQRNDYMGALLTINRGLRQMYGHAYQSFVWNHVASFRWAKYGSRLIEGDLILVDDDRPQRSKPLDGDEEMPDTNEEYDNFYASARPLTAADIASGKYTIFDVVLPQPGYDVVYPTNEIGQFYKTFMASEQGGKLDPYSMRRKHKEFSLSGGYRNLISRFQTTPEYLVRTYSRDEEQMYPTDLDLVLARKAREQAEIKDLKRRRSLGGEPASASSPATEDMAAAAAQNKRVKMDDAPAVAAAGDEGDDRSAFLLARLEEMAASANDSTDDLTAALASSPIIDTPLAAGTPRAVSPSPAVGPSSGPVPAAPVVPVLRQVTGNTTSRFAPGAYSWERVGGSDDLGDKIAVILKFQLPASSYATVVLRELQTALAGERNPKCD
jgi:tRNA pseudouridine13 synthase